MPDTTNTVPAVGVGRPVTSPNTVGEATAQGKPSRASTVPGVLVTRATVPLGGTTVCSPVAETRVSAWGVRFVRFMPP